MITANGILKEKERFQLAEIKIKFCCGTEGILPPSLTKHWSQELVFISEEPEFFHAEKSHGFMS